MFLHDRFKLVTVSMLQFSSIDQFLIYCIVDSVLLLCWSCRCYLILMAILTSSSFENIISIQIINKSNLSTVHSHLTRHSRSNSSTLIAAICRHHCKTRALAWGHPHITYAKNAYFHTPYLMLHPIRFWAPMHMCTVATHHPA